MEENESEDMGRMMEGNVRIAGEYTVMGWREVVKRNEG